MVRFIVGGQNIGGGLYMKSSSGGICLGSVTIFGIDWVVLSSVSLWCSMLRCSGVCKCSQSLQV